MSRDLADLFGHLADRGYGDDAPTYRTLARAVAADEELLSIVAAAPADRRAPNNLFAAVRFLLLDGYDHPLADVFAAITAHAPGRVDRQSDSTVGSGATAPSESDVVAGFGDFVRTHRDAVVDAMGFRSIQTNEPGRCAHIAASLALIGRRHGRMALVDVGASAGLNLAVDRCHIDFGVVATGPADSPLQLDCRLIGGGVPPVEPSLPPVGWRLGLDRDPIDLDDEPSRRWLQSCVWIDQVDRDERLRRAIDLARTEPALIVTGDAIDDLPALLARVPDELHLVVVTTWVLFYFGLDQRAAFEGLLAAAGRPISWVSLDYPAVIDGIDRPDDTPDERITPSVLGLMTFDGEGTAQREFLGWAHHHGTWLDWRVGRS